MTDKLKQPDDRILVLSIASDSTSATPCRHCFCSVTTDNRLRCHRCGTTKPYEPPKPETCLMCNGTGVTYQARSHDGDFDVEPLL